MEEKYPYKHINKHSTKKIMLGNVSVGGDSAIAVQSMTNTLTTDIDATLAQIQRCFDLGAELMRVSVPDRESTIALRQIVKDSPVPIIADVHFHYKRAIEAVEAGASCIRINPGNIGSIERLKDVVTVCKSAGVPIRVGVNVGSLEGDILEKYNNNPCPEALVESAIKNVRLIEDCGYDQIKISVKASDVMLMYKSYELLSKQTNYPLHLGVTEAGPAFAGTVKSSIAIGGLLMNGIGDTLRVSLSADPEEEIKVCWAILKSLEIRKRGINIISCPSCARQQFDVITMVAKIESLISHVKQNIDVSILGCVVNGIGEATRSHIGITGAQSGQHLIYLHGKPYDKAKTEDLANAVARIVNQHFAE
jgi:(E)-4-hydroxy-3-methylbut-2-enyl-diphosphate synthase